MAGVPVMPISGVTWVQETDAGVSPAANSDTFNNCANVSASNA